MLRALYARGKVEAGKVLIRAGLILCGAPRNAKFTGFDVVQPDAPKPQPETVDEDDDSDLPLYQVVTEPTSAPAPAPEEPLAGSIQDRLRQLRNF